MARHKQTCPICSKPIAEDEQLIAYYFAPKDWWVVHHVKNVIGSVSGGNEGKFKLLDTREICSRAGFTGPQRR